VENVSGYIVLQWLCFLGTITFIAADEDLEDLFLDVWSLLSVCSKTKNPTFQSMS
jgi:hypothetical protein